MKKLHLYIQSANTLLSIEGSNVMLTSPNQQRRYPLQNVTSIIIEGDTILSSRVVTECISHRVDLIFQDDRGRMITRMDQSPVSHRYQIAYKQLRYVDTMDATKACSQWLVDKLHNQVAWVSRLENQSIVNQRLYHKHLTTMKAQLSNPDMIDTIRSKEGWYGKLYFMLLKTLVDGAWAFSVRSKRPARDLFNACLNYSYGLLYWITEDALISAGLDLYVGMNHSMENQSKSLLYDFVEPYRPWVDEYLVRHYIPQQSHPSNLTEATEVVLLTKEARRCLATGMLEWMNTVIRYNNRQLSRRQHIYQNAKALRNTILKYKLRQ